MTPSSWHLFRGSKDHYKHDLQVAGYSSDHRLREHKEPVRWPGYNLSKEQARGSHRQLDMGVSPEGLQGKKLDCWRGLCVFPQRASLRTLHVQYPLLPSTRALLRHLGPAKGPGVRM